MSPFPTTHVIHPRWSEHHQPVAEGGMTGTCRVTVAGTGDGTFDDVSGYTTPPARVTLYEGPCRVQADFRPRPEDEAEQDTSVQHYLVAIKAGSNDVPYSAQVQILAAPNDAQLIGRRLFVESATLATERFERDLMCTLAATPGTPV